MRCAQFLQQRVTTLHGRRGLRGKLIRDSGPRFPLGTAHVGTFCLVRSKIPEVFHPPPCLPGLGTADRSYHPFWEW